MSNHFTFLIDVNNYLLTKSKVINESNKKNDTKGNYLEFAIMF